MRARRSTSHARGGGLLLGSHDFSAFGFIDEAAQPVADPRRPVREPRRLDVEEQTAGQQRLLFVVEADRFLMRMARMLVGTLVEVGSGRLSVPTGALLGAARRTPAVVTAPAAGLSLDAVFYDDDHAVGVLRDAARLAEACRRRVRFRAGLRPTEVINT